MQLHDCECSVCAGPASHKQDSDEGRLYEEERVCRAGCWEYHFSYGYTRERVGDQWWEWNYTEEAPYNEIRKAILDMKHAIANRSH
jgi:hypothetical protein